MIDTIYTIGHCPLKIALLSDIHDRPSAEVILSLWENSPDIICIAGDFIYGILPEKGKLKMAESVNAMGLLKACASIADTFLSLGNHEWMLCEEDLSMIKETGVRLLDDGFVRFNDIVIGGLSSGNVSGYRKFRESSGSTERYPFMRNMFERLKKNGPECAWLSDFEKEPGYRILLSHHPSYYEKYLKNRDIDLILSGHEHGGQIRLFGRGLVSREQGLFPKYCQGVHDSRLVISRGLANTLRIPRLFNETEIVYITPEQEGDF